MPEEAVSAVKTFLAHYMILRVYTVMHNNTFDITNMIADSLQFCKKKRWPVGGWGGGTDMAVSVARACK